MRMAKERRQAARRRGLPQSRLAYHLRCLREDATDPDTTSVERLALVRDRVGRIHEIREELRLITKKVPDTF
jgi:hypothetical protein